MELFRFVAVEHPSASSVDRILKLDLEPDLKKSKVARDLLDPKKRALRLKNLKESVYSAPARLSGVLGGMDAFATWVKDSARTPTQSAAIEQVRTLFKNEPKALLREPRFAAARSLCAEQHLVDRLSISKRPRTEQLKTKTRLQCVALIGFLADGGEQAARALRIPFCIALEMEPRRFENGGAPAPAGAAPGAARPKPEKNLTAPQLAKIELELKRAYGVVISRELEKHDADDSDSLERALAAPRGRAAVANPDSMAEMVLTTYASSRAFQQVQGMLTPSVRGLVGELDLPRNASMNDVLDRLDRKLKQIKHDGKGSPRFLAFGGKGGLLWSSLPAPLAPPTDGAPDTVGASRLLGFGKLNRVVDKVIGYRTAQLSEVYNVPMGSTKERELRLVERSEELIDTLTSKVTTQETETESEERFSLASESRKLSVFDAQARAGGGFSASYGTVSVEGSAEASVGFRAESADELSTDYSKSVVSRAATKITERVEEMRRRATFRERTAGEKEAYTNTSASHITGIYQWINEVHEGKLLEYSERLMLEVIVPKPGASLLWAPGAVPPNPGLPQPPPDFDVLLDDPDLLEDPALQSRAISRDTYLKLAAKYGASDVPAPPEAVKVLMKGIVVGDMAVKGTFTTVAHTDESLRVPDGYEARRGWMRLVASRMTDPLAVWYRVVIGTSQYKFPGGGGSKRTFSYALSINDDRGNFRGTVPISVTGREDRAVVVHVMLSCTPTAETMDAWRAEVYGLLLLAYKRALQDYQDAAGSAFAAPTSRNPDQLRRMERDEIKRAALTIITGQHFERFNALPANQPAEAPPSITLTEVEPEGDWIQFFENAVEWENSDFVLYPYFWSDRADWARAMTMRVEDSKHEEFLRAGAARVLLPVRRGFESAVLRYRESSSGSPVLWDGLDPDLITLDSPMHVAVWQEIKERQGQLDETPAEVGTWRFEVPTNHRILRDDGILPAPPPDA
jgi:hypothetical protein